MASTFDSSSTFNHHEDQENQPILTDTQDSSEKKISEEIIDEQPTNCSPSEETDIVENNATNLINSANMVTAEASFTEATSTDIPVGATRSSVARILVKHGQIFRVQVDNEVKEVHGKSSNSDRCVVLSCAKLSLLIC